MDVEGAEVEILENALMYFRENKEHAKILFECHQYTYRKNGVSERFADILNEFITLGFNIEYVVATL
jgi:hypothetical protein